jgi:4'-phosphopantetheinyl transferase
MLLPPDISYRILHVDEAAAAPWEEILSAAEKARLLEWKHEKRRREFIAGRMAARLLLADRLKIPPTDISVGVADTGAVHAGDHNLFLSISHSGEWAAAAVGDKPLGVDLERITPRRPDLHRFILHFEEYNLLDRLPLTRDEALILCWTLKEAALKAGCTGFRQSPKSFRLEIEPDKGAAVVRGADGERWNSVFERVADCYLAIAYEP